MSISKTRQKLVDVARELFAHKGMEATTMNDIAQASGKGRRTLYTYFRNKEEIYYAVIEGELERLSEQLDEVTYQNATPEEKLIAIIYTHLAMIRETVSRNGSLRAEFFRNIWMVEKVRKAFDEEETLLIRRVLEEGVNCGKFHIESIDFLADIIHFSIKGLEVPYIYDRLGEGLSDEESRTIVTNVVLRALGMHIPRQEPLVY
jgi:AcrR family transcriptional regulator